MDAARFLGEGIAHIVAILFDMFLQREHHHAHLLRQFGGRRRRHFAGRALLSDASARRKVPSLGHDRGFILPEAAQARRVS